jgi:hypothetical protein
VRAYPPLGVGAELCTLVSWRVAAGMLGAVAGLVAFGAVAGAGHRFAVAGLVTFVPVKPF